MVYLLCHCCPHETQHILAFTLHPGLVSMTFYAIPICSSTIYNFLIYLYICNDTHFSCNFLPPPFDLPSPFPSLLSLFSSGYTLHSAGGSKPCSTLLPSCSALWCIPERSSIVDCSGKLQCNAANTQSQ